jgi:hypothetical protein
MTKAEIAMCALYLKWFRQHVADKGDALVQTIACEDERLDAAAELANRITGLDDLLAWVRSEAQ